MTKKFTCKLLILLLAIAATLCLVFGLTACGGGNDSVDSGTVSGNTSQSGGSTDDNSGNNNDDGDNTENDDSTDSTADSVLKFSLSSDGTYYTVSGINSTDNEIVIPSTYNDLPVTGIESNAFNNCTTLTSITIGENITSIGSGAFNNCTALTTIYYNATNAEDLEKNFIFSNAGTDGDGISVIIGDNVKHIPANLFNTYDSLNITSITIGKGVTSIGELAFNNSEELTEVNFNATAMEDIDIDLYDSSKSAGYIFDQAGDNSDGIVVNIGANVTRIPDFLFRRHGESNIVKIVFEENSACERIGDYAFYWSENLSEITLPESLIEIGKEAFNECRGLTSITIPDSVTTIGDFAFGNDVNITSFYIGKGLTSIGGSAFGNCTAIAEVHITDLSAWCNISFTNSYSNPLYYNTADLYLNGERLTGDIVLDNTVKAIPYGTFSDSTITSITIPASVTSIGNRAFYNCTELTKINYNATAAEISSTNDSFYNAGKNGSGIIVTIGSNVTKIPAYLFGYSYSNITSVVFEDGSLCESIGDYAFAYCTALTSFANLPANITFNTNIVNGCTKLDVTTLSLVSNNVKYFGTQMISVADTTAEYIIVKDGTTTIEANAFNGCTKLRLVYIPESVTQIGSGALDCGAGSDLIIYFGASSIPSGYTSWLGQYAYTYESGGSTASANIYYSYCTGISISGDYLYSGSTLYAYFGTASTVTFPSELGGTTIKKIGNSATVLVTSGVSYVKPLSSFIGAKNITCPATITEVENYAFYNNTDIESIKFLSDSGSLLIDSAAFYGCTNLNSVTFTEGAKLQLQWASFYGCTSLTSIIIPSTASVINLEAFEGSGLTSITLTGFTIASLLNSDATSSISLTLSDYTSAQLAALITTTYSDYNWTLWALNI